MKKINLNGQELVVLLSTKDPHYSEERTDVVVLRGTTLQNLTIHNDLLNGKFEEEWGLEVAEGVTLDSSDAELLSLEALALYNDVAIIGNAAAYNEMAKGKVLEIISEEMADLNKRIFQLDGRLKSL